MGNHDADGTGIAGTAASGPRIDRWTLIGLALLLAPLLTMAHELAGHALTCMATGHRPTELGAYYIECPGAQGWARRVVAMAGTGMDVVLATLAGLAWSRARTPLWRLILWAVFTIKGMVAAGYWLFSGVTGFGDWGPNPDGIGLLAHPLAWRGLLVLVGLIAYVAVVRLSMRRLDAMLGGGAQARAVGRRCAMTLYLVGGAVALLVSLANPHGIVITLLSAVASSFGGTAGLFNVAFRPPAAGAPRPFVVGRQSALLLAGLLLTAAFAWWLGPTIYLR